MPNVIWTQDDFSQGELSPLMYAKSSIGNYYNALKTAQNVLCKPQGGAGKRFGTLYQAILSGFSAATDFVLAIFQYANESIYQLIIVNGQIFIYLEGILIATVSTPFTTYQIQNMDFTTLGIQFVMSFPNIRPATLTRSASSANIIASTSGNLFLLTTAITAGQIIPIQFTTTGTLPVTSPQIVAGVTYYYFAVNTGQIAIYATSQDAKNRTNQFLITNTGTGTNSIVPQNTWTLGNYPFIVFPAFDFTQNYNAITFTPSATSATTITITASSAIFSSAYVGGLFAGNGGLGHIQSVTDSTHIVIVPITSFSNTNAIQGSAVLLAEPAWSDARGWPSKVSSYQNRAIFANSTSLHNGVWLSTINDYTSFDDSQTDDDNAISWYPTSGNVSYINFIVPYRSLTIHTNAGVYSSPLSANAAITPSNFSLILNDGAPANNLKPVSIDNQIIVSSGNDVYSLVWDGINNAYTSQLVSVINEQVIRNPTDEASFLNLMQGSGRYVFIVNLLGSLAIYQTLITEAISGWTPNVTEQSYGNSYFRAVASAFDRAWFVTERQIATQTNTYSINGFTNNTLQTSVTNDFSTTSPTAVLFVTSGTLPGASIPLTTTQYYYVTTTDNINFIVYENISDALAGINALTFTSAGTSSSVEEWPPATQFFLEELTFATFLDCAVQYSGSPSSTVSVGTQFNAQDLKAIGDGYGFDGNVVGGVFTFLAHGVAQSVSNAFIGFPINTIIEPLPISIAQGGPHNNNLTRPKHVRSIDFIFNNTIGGEINGVPIAINTFNQANIGNPPVPAAGVVEVGIMNAWDDFNNPNFTLTHNDPFDIQLLGLFYYVDI